jgi:hypothetical protein
MRDIDSIPQKEWELIGDAVVMAIDIADQLGLAIATDFSNALFELESRRPFQT